MVATAPGWFSLSDVPIVLGRDVSFADTAATDYRVVIGADLARAVWGNANPIGRSLLSPALPGATQDSIAMTVVGVYDATRRLPGMEWSEPGASGATMGVFTARGRQWRRDVIVVRTRGPAEPFLPELQRFVRVHAPSLPVTSMVTLAQEDEKKYEESLRMTALAGAGGCVALLLASLGLYGVIALAVRQRTREIGVRIALGAHPMRVARMFLASGVRASLLGLALGLPLSIAALRIGQSQGLAPASLTSPYLIGAVVACVLLAVASAATWLPARRAARVDPARTLRVD
jgi:ABC-type antimicrobial peptide transport system permease subunit